MLLCKTRDDGGEGVFVGVGVFVGDCTVGAAGEVAANSSMVSTEGLVSILLSVLLSVNETELYTELEGFSVCSSSSALSES